MVLQDKYKRANSSRYRATHGGMESNRQLRAKAVASASSASPSHHFPPLVPADPSPSSSSSLADHPPPSVDDHLLPTPTPSSSSAFARRVLASNADRYLEPEPDPNLDEEETEAEIDLLEFVAKQKRKIAEQEGRGNGEEDLEDVDESFDLLFEHGRGVRGGGGGLREAGGRGRGGSKVVVVADRTSLGLEELDEQRKKADATRDLIARFSATKRAPNNAPSNSLVPRTRPSPKSADANSSNTLSSNQPKEVVTPLDDQDFLDQVLDDASGTYGKLKRT